ncbi:MAG TPA: 3-hydroxyacyl-CoA dehydrogenase family protein [Trueperaceae bacterium]|nr:3-hydroxyacyl-CoA dehydrogenase family protein [Trueperaceae bacterium]
MNERGVPGVDRVAVVGAGLMGSGIAAVLVASGFEVSLFDTSAEALERAAQRSAKLSSQNGAAGGAGSLELHGELEDAVASAGLVIEAVPEVMDLKRELFARIDRVALEGAYLATNTSELSVTAIAAATERPERVVGMHWFNPPERMRLVEMVRAVRSSPEALAVVSAVAEACGKTVVTVEDRQGFVTTRVVAAVLLEGARLLEEGVATREDIDAAVRLGLNHPMGPLELADYIGLDTVLLIADAMTEAYGDRFRPPQGLRKLVEAGRLGRKSGGGYYDR